MKTQIEQFIDGMDSMSLEELKEAAEAVCNKIDEVNREMLAHSKSMRVATKEKEKMWRVLQQTPYTEFLKMVEKVESKPSYNWVQAARLVEEFNQLCSKHGWTPYEFYNVRITSRDCRPDNNLLGWK